MKNKGISNSIVQHLSSRNFDISGFWGIGILCKYAIHRNNFISKSFTKSDLLNSKELKVSGYIVTELPTKLLTILGSREFEKLEIRFRFIRSSIQLSSYDDIYDCQLEVLIFGQGSYGFSINNILCWPHNSEREMRRITY